MKLFDTNIWIEYFKGSRKGERVKTLLQSETVYTSAISLAEIAKWVSENGGNVDKFVAQVKKSTIVQANENILVESGKLYGKVRDLKKSIGMIDLIIYTTGLLQGVEIVTFDEDFIGLPNVAAF